jgi:guanidinopropionase
MSGSELERARKGAILVLVGHSDALPLPWNEDPAACDIALVGVPHSSGNGSTERDQPLAAPCVMSRASTGAPTVSMA